MSKLMPKDVAKTIKLIDFGGIGSDFLRFWSVLEKGEFLMHLDWPRVGLPNQKNQKKSSEETSGTIQGFPSRGHGGGGGEVNLPPGSEG